MQRRGFIKALSALALGAWVPDWIPSEIISVEAQVTSPVIRVSEHPELLDTALREIFFQTIRDTPNEYRSLYSSIGA